MLPSVTAKRLSFRFGLPLTPAALLFLFVPAVGAATAPTHKLPQAKPGELVVGLCDGETHVVVKKADSNKPMDKAQAQAVSDKLMAAWRAKNPNAKWEDVPPIRSSAQMPHAEAPPHAAKTPLGTNEAQQQTYGAFSERDEKIWRASVDSFIADGKEIFHNADKLGGTIGVSCDMCHPDAANTHPETYPKYQVQMGRVALLRDMINWCIENPVRGKPLEDNDPKLKAMEGYILAQRRGKVLEYGKH